MNIKGEVILPPIKTFTIEDSVKDQARKVLEEAAELFVSTTEYEKFKGVGGNIKEVYLNDIISEAMDTVQAVCNLLEMLQVWDDDIAEAYEAVVEKNTKRGVSNGFMGTYADTEVRRIRDKTLRGSS